LVTKPASLGRSEVLKLYEDEERQKTLQRTPKSSI
jgi:hypothetical protein